jgi:hypothetical protein
MESGFSRIDGINLPSVNHIWFEFVNERGSAAAGKSGGAFSVPKRARVFP